MTMQRRTKADKQLTATASAKASKKSRRYSAKSSAKKTISHHHGSYYSLSYSGTATADYYNDPLIFIDDDLDPNASSDSTHDDTLIFVDDDAMQGNCRLDNIINNIDQS